MGKILVLIPAYNAEYTISKVVIIASQYADQVIVYNDGSTDITPTLAEKVGAVVIGSDENKGKGFALRELFNFAKDINPLWVVTLDADDQHDPSQIPKFIELAEKEKYDIVIGKRENMSTFRKIGNKMFGIFTDIGIDTQSGYRLYNRNAIYALRVRSDNFAADQQILEDLMRKKFKVGEIIIENKYNSHSHSKGLVFHVADIVRDLFFRKSLLTFCLAGSVLMIMGLQLILQVLTTWELYRDLAVGTLILGELSIIVGVVTFFTGITLHLVQRMVWS